jgi:membrane protease YdiL (CAAX protease family)
MNRLLTVLLCPEGRLQANFPWSGKAAAGKYVRSVWVFFKASFAIPLLMLGCVYALTLFPTIFWSFLDRQKELQVLGITAALGALVPLLWSLRNRWLKRDPLPAPARLLAHSVISGLLAVNLLLVAVPLLKPVYVDLMTWLVSVMSTPDGQPNMTFLMGMSTISFVMGFTAQMRFINSCLKADNLSLVDTMALHVRARRGRHWLLTVLNVVYPVAIAYGIVYCLGETVVYFMGPPDQPTVAMARAATGGNFVLFALMAAIGAPIFEELVFRGFLYQVVRSVLRQPGKELELAKEPTAGQRFLGLRLMWMRADNFVRQLSHPPVAWVQARLRSCPDLVAMLLSSTVFALIHMQFNPTTLVLLFALGCIHAELYRRTGSLWCSILLHALNNGLDVYQIGMGG